MMKSDLNIELIKIIYKCNIKNNAGNIKCRNSKII